MTYEAKVASIEAKLKRLANLLKDPQIGLGTWWALYDEVTSDIEALRYGKQSLPPFEYEYLG